MCPIRSVKKDQIGRVSRKSNRIWWYSKRRNCLKTDSSLRRFRDRVRLHWFFFSIFEKNKGEYTSRKRAWKIRERYQIQASDTGWEFRYRKKFQLFDWVGRFHLHPIKKLTCFIIPSTWKHTRTQWATETGVRDEEVGWYI